MKKNDIAEMLAMLDQIEQSSDAPDVEKPLIPENIFDSFWEGLRPIAAMTVTEWANQFRVLDEGSSAIPGRYSSKRTPYAEAIMDALSPSAPYQKVVFVAGTQIGKTEIGNNWIGHTMDVDPAPMLMIMATDQTARDAKRDRIDKMVASCPSIAEKTTATSKRDGQNNSRRVQFKGGVLTITGAGSTAEIKSKPIRKLFADEVDEYAKNLKEQGDVVGLAEKRLDTFGSKKKEYLCSTPTTATSKIWALFEKTDMNLYHVPCPHCGEMQVIVWENIKWEEGKPETAALACIECGALIDERFKTEMLEKGQWRPSNPDRISNETIGFHLPALYSPLGWFSWSQAVEKYIEAYEETNDANLQMVFVNTIEGRPYMESQEVPEWKVIEERSGGYEINEIPEGVLFLSAGADVQKDRIEMSIYGWGVGKTSWLIDHRVFNGSTESADNEVWANFANVVENETWGNNMPIIYTALDSGAYTSIVYEVVADMKKRGARIAAVKGMDKLDAVIRWASKVDTTPAGKTIGGIKPCMVGVSMLKTEFYGYLKLKKEDDGTVPLGFCHYPKMDNGFFQGLVSEALQTKKNSKGYEVEEWVKVPGGRRNEPLDCRNYARAAAAVCGLDKYRGDGLIFHAEQLAKTYNKGASKPVKKEVKQPKPTRQAANISDRLANSRVFKK